MFHFWTSVSLTDDGSQSQIPSKGVMRPFHDGFSNLSRRPTSHPWNRRPLGGSERALRDSVLSISRMVSAGKNTSSSVALRSSMSFPASGPERAFQNIFMASLPGAEGA